MLELLDNLNQILSLKLKDRVIDSPLGPTTQRYIAKDAKVEIGFVSLDLYSNVDYLVLYELFVLKEFRDKGYGTKILTKVAEIAQNLHYEKIKVNPEPFERDRSKDSLIEWYRKRGFTSVASAKEELEFVIT